MDERSGKREWIPVLLLLALGIALRAAALGRIPAGLNQDEASAAYEAWALMTEGLDRAGSLRPVLLTAWGSGQNILYTWLTIPVFGLFGISMATIRLVGCLIGCAALPLFYLLMRRLFGAGAAVWGLLALALNPWHIMLSRWALESNLLPFFLLLGVYFLIWGASRARALPFLLAGASFALALYAYGTAFMFLPFFLVAAVVWSLRRGVRLVCMLPGALLFAALALPIVLTNIINMFGLPQMTLFGLTLPRLTEARQIATTVFGGGGLRAAAGNLWAFLKLLITQSDGLIFNSLPGFGTMYYFGLAFSLWGAVWAAKNRRGGLIFIWLLCCLPAAALTEVNINRINMVFLPLLVFAGAGVWRCGECLAELTKARAARFLPAALYLCAGLAFAITYFGQFNARTGESFFAGFTDAVAYAETVADGDIYVTDEVNMPYIYVLLENRIPPSEFISTVVYLNPGGAFQWVRSFGRYEFGDDFSPPDGDTVYIVHWSEVAGFDGWNCRDFGNYRVLWK